MEAVSREQLKKIFKKSKNFKPPRNFDEIKFSKIKFLGWWDQTANRVYIVHKYNGEMCGIAFDVMKLSSKPLARAFCEICQKHRKRDEIVMVSAPTRKKPKDVEYRIRGMYICGDLKQCEKDTKDLSNLEDLFEWILDKE